MQDLFLEIIRVAIGSQTNLSRLPLANEWDELFEAAKKQSLVGIMFIGLQKLGADADEGFARIGMSEDLYFTWLGLVTDIQLQNQQINDQCVELIEEFKALGRKSTILKGQGVATYYRVRSEESGVMDFSLLRQPGDIDIWVDGGQQSVMDYVNARTPNREFDRKHTHYNRFDDTTVEVHWTPSVSGNPFVNKKLQKFYHDQSISQMAHEVTMHDGKTIMAPDAEFQCVHLMLHLQGHFLYEGVGLRQLLDLYFVMLDDEVQKAKDQILQRYREFGLMRMAHSVMWVMQEVFGMENDLLICEADSRRGKELLREIMEGGNFGKYSGENRVQNESFSSRMARRMKRRVRLMKYDPVGAVCAPWNKMCFFRWKNSVIKKYNL